MNIEDIDDGRGNDKFPAYAGVMVKFGNKVLLCKRREDIPESTLPGYWSVPAGYVELHEDIKECAVREFAEETQVDLDFEQTKFLAAYPAADGCGVFYDYLFESDKELVPTLDEEHSEWGYFGVNEIPNPITDEMRNDVKLALS